MGCPPCGIRSICFRMCGRAGTVSSSQPRIHLALGAYLAALRDTGPTANTSVHIALHNSAATASPAAHTAIITMAKISISVIRLISNTAHPLRRALGDIVLDCVGNGLDRSEIPPSSNTRLHSVQLWPAGTYVPHDGHKSFRLIMATPSCETVDLGTRACRQKEMLSQRCS